MRILARTTFVSAVLLAGCGEPSATYCEAPAGIDASPNSLAAAFELIDALPHPVTVPCFVESLERPLELIASTNDFSAQPADANSPRLLVIIDELVVSWVSSGIGSERLEFAEKRPNARSVKAEILMPVEGPITSASFEHILHEGGTGTVCSGCHFDERPVDIGFGEFYESGALRVASDEIVRVPHLRSLHDECDAAVDARRCDILAAVFEYGEVRDTDFPSELPTVYD